MIQQLHARLFDINGYQILAYLDHDENDVLFVAFRAWADGIVGPIEFSIKLQFDVGEKAVELWEAAQREIMADMTEDRCRAALEKAGFFDLISRMSRA
jgi:hypothetical protein